ncbi:hypothetical protein ACFT30_06925 [Microbacterium ureisolvens]|uniref:hypothetical protein n=1 Tax=Microbacterium TaxID=33882 RepID=UPI000D643B00|nr:MULTISPECIES: hypothetical protein [Microbacterium]
MPSVTDWISSIGSLVGALTGVGALIVAVLSYRKSNRALAADARTRGAVGATVEAVDALGRAGKFDEMLDAALKRRADAETHGLAVGGGSAIGRERPDGPDEKDAYEAALRDARRELGIA